MGGAAGAAEPGGGGTSTVAVALDGQPARRSEEAAHRRKHAGAGTGERRKGRAMEGADATPLPGASAIPRGAK